MASLSRVTLKDIVAETGINLELLERECTQEKLLSLAEYCDPLTVMGRALGLGETQVESIERDYRSTEEKRVVLLMRWKQTFAFMATYKMFIEALLSIGRVQQATEICQLLAKDEGTYR